jgi:proteic killer suppression protein
MRSFRDQVTEDVFNGRNTRAARRICPVALWNLAAGKLDQVDSVEALEELRVPPGNHLEALGGDRKGHNIRINSRYRVCFRWSPVGPSNV